MCVSVCKYAYVYKVWAHVHTQTHSNWICIPALVWGHISSSTQTHTDTHHKLSAPYSHKYCVKDGILLHSLHLSFRPLSAIHSTPSEAVIILKLELPAKETLLYQSHNTPTLNSAQPIYTQPIRLVCSHWKCLWLPNQFILDDITKCC